MKSNNYSDTIDKVDVEDLIQGFRILNIDSLSSYLKEVWKVLFLYPGPCITK